MDKLTALLVVLIGVVITGMFAASGSDIGTLVGVAVVAVGLNLLWSAARRPTRR